MARWKEDQVHNCLNDIIVMNKVGVVSVGSMGGDDEDGGIKRGGEYTSYETKGGWPTRANSFESPP